MQFKILLLASTALVIAARAGAGDDNTAAIQNALKQLDPTNNDHWTADGLARIDTVKALSGDTSLNREMLEKAAPGFNREQAGGENRVGGGLPAGPAAGTGTGDGGRDTATGAAPAAPPPAPEQAAADPMAAALADGWAKHPTADGYHYKGQDVKTDAEVAAMYSGDQGAQSAPADGGQTAGEPSDQAQDISGQTGMGGAMTARSPEPVEGELRKTHVSEPSQGEPGEAPIGVTQGVTETGVNQLGTPDGPVENAGRHIELSGEVAARSAGSTLTPSQAPADASNAEGISLGGAADPVVEARAPGGAVVAEGAAPATFFEGPTAGGPFGESGITAGDGTSQTQLGALGDVDFEGDPDAVEALEAQLASQAETTNSLRQQVDDLSSQLHTSLRTEAQLRRQIEANRPRSANMTTIQTFLRTSQERRAANVQSEREVRAALGKK